MQVNLRRFSSAEVEPIKGTTPQIVCIRLNGQESVLPGHSNDEINICITKPEQARELIQAGNEALNLIMQGMMGEEK